MLILEPRLELLLLEPPLDAVDFGLTGIPKEFTVRDADRLQKRNQISYKHI